MEIAEFLMRILLLSALSLVLFFCFTSIFKKTHGKMVLAQLINTVNGDRIDITGWESAIGRAKTCDIVLNYSAISRFHAVIARRNKGWIVFDTHSKAGVFVNGKKIKKQAYIYDGDLLTIGNLVMCFRSPLFKRDDKSKQEDSQAKPVGEVAGASPASRQAYSSGRILSALQSLEDDSIILLFLDEYLIGRAGNSDITIPIISVSRRHARLTNGNRGWVLEDLGSRHGTKLNNKKIQSNRRLNDGDIIEIGGMQYAFIEAFMRE